MSLRIGAVFIAGLCAACSDGTAGLNHDPLPDAADAAAADEGVVMDTDLPLDAGLEADAGQVPDAGFTVDTGVAADVGLAPDAVGFPDADPGDTGTTRYPIILAHGWGASPTVLGFGAVEADLRAHGYQAYATTVPPFDSAEHRGLVLKAAVDQIFADTGAAKINIIGHSMGGLDARHLITGLGYGDRVASLSTVSTPHRGSAVADVILGLQAGASTVAINALVAIFGNAVSTMGMNPDVRASFVALSEANAAGFNQAHPDDPRVYYQSWAGLSNIGGIATRNDESACQSLLLFDPMTRDVMDPALIALAPMAAHGLRLWPNDGLVPVESAIWGHFRGCLGADHADEVGAFNDTPPNPQTGYDYLAFYRSVAAELMAMGF